MTVKTERSAILFPFCVCLTMGIFASRLNAASDRDDVKKAQQSLADKGFYHGDVDGIPGPQTRKAIGDYERSERQ